MSIIKHFLYIVEAAVNLIISQIEFTSKQLEIWCSNIEFDSFPERLYAGQGLAVGINIVQNVFLQANLNIEVQLCRSKRYLVMVFKCIVLLLLHKAL